MVSILTDAARGSGRLFGGVVMAKGSRDGNCGRVCGKSKANVKFSGRGHAAHICKLFASLPAAEKAERRTLNRLDGMLGRRLNEAEYKWLRNRMKDARPAVKQAACEVHGFLAAQRGWNR